MDAKALRRLRAKNSWTQEYIAGVIGVDRNVVTKWELGLHRIPASAERLLLLLTNLTLPRDPEYWRRLHVKSASKPKQSQAKEKPAWNQRRGQPRATHPSR